MGTPASSATKTGRHDIAEILLKVALNTINQSNQIMYSFKKGLNDISGAFDEEEIIHVEGDVNPARDLDIIHSELRFKDTEYLNKQMNDLEKSVARSGDKKRKPDYVKFLWLLIFVDAKVGIP